MVSNSEFSDTHSSVGSGSTRSWTSFTVIEKLQRLILVLVGVLGGELELVAGRRPGEILVDLIDPGGPAADLVVVAIGGHPGDRLALVGGGDVDHDLVALGSSSLDGLEVGELLAHPVDRLVDIVVAHLDGGNLDLQGFVATDLDRWPDLDDGVEGDGALVLAGRDVDLGRGDDVDLVLAHGGGVVVGKGLPEGLTPGILLPDPSLEDLAWRLARTEARESNLPGQTGEGGVEVLFELSFVELDHELDLVALEGLNRGLHRLKCTDAGSGARPVVRAGAIPVGNRPRRGRLRWSPIDGMWRSLAAHLLWEQGVGSSNLPIPTTNWKRVSPTCPGRRIGRW